MKHGIPLIAFLIVAAICGAVGYVIGETRRQLMMQEAEFKGFGKTMVDTRTGQEVFIWASADLNLCIDWKSTYAANPHLKLRNRE